jgi:hypothetical protein
VGTFAEKLKQFEHNGFIGSKDRDVLEAALDAGSATAHLGCEPERETLNQAMDMVEHVLEAVYVLGQAANDIRMWTPLDLIRIGGRVSYVDRRSFSASNTGQ